MKDFQRRRHYEIDLVRRLGKQQRKMEPIEAEIATIQGGGLSLKLLTLSLCDSNKT